MYSSYLISKKKKLRSDVEYQKFLGKTLILSGKEKPDEISLEGLRKRFKKVLVRYQYLQPDDGVDEKVVVVISGFNHKITQMYRV